MGPVPSRWFVVFVLSVFAFFVFAIPARATQISGTISSTLMIGDDSELIGDVTCKVAGAACISVVSSGITIHLNGFAITEDITGCTPETSSQDGIDVLGQHDVAIVGPGLVQKFGGLGILLGGATRVKVEGVTASDNCFSGILLGFTVDSDIEKNVSVRNSMGSGVVPCGGT
jgi:hypothetical protein